MPRINVKLVVARDGETGMLGLVIKGLQRVDNEVNTASSGVLIAHDLIEHVNGLREIGTITDELEALGAIWYVRGQHSDLSRDGTGSAYTPHQNIASDVTRMYRDYFYGSYVNMAKLNTRACDADSDFAEVISEACKEKEHEFDADDAQSARDKWDDYARVCLERMRVGYRKARRKWERLGRYAANTAFWEVARAVEPNTRRCDFEGKEFKLTFDGNTATCEEIYDDSDY